MNTNKMNFKNINIGQLIKQRVTEYEIEIARICNFMNCTETEIKNMYLQKDLSSDLLLKWSKLLEYDFFRIYTQHLILYAPPTKKIVSNNKSFKSAQPSFRKNIYTKEIIDFIIELVETKKKTKIQIIQEYRIPRTTLYKWLKKYNG